MNDLILRLSDEATELPLREGMQAIARDAAGLHAVEARAGADGTDALVHFCLDRRGVWLTVSEGGGSVHVNGRRVRRMAMLRVGDAVYVDGSELVLTRADGRELHHDIPLDAVAEANGDLRVLLRGVGGPYHGRSITLERPRLVGSAAEADIRIDDPAFAPRHAQLERIDEHIVLRDLGSGEGSVLNGQPVRDALLQPGDQLMFDAQHRFVVEAPGKLARAEPSLLPEFGDAGRETMPGTRSWRRWPWLLLAALLIGGALAALLMFGSTR